MLHNDLDIDKILIPIIYQSKQWLPSPIITFFLLSPLIFFVISSILNFISELTYDRPLMEIRNSFNAVTGTIGGGRGEGGTHIVGYLRGPLYVKGRIPS